MVTKSLNENISCLIVRWTNKNELDNEYNTDIKASKAYAFGQVGNNHIDKLYNNWSAIFFICNPYAMVVVTIFPESIYIVWYSIKTFSSFFFSFFTYASARMCVLCYAVRRNSSHEFRSITKRFHVVVRKSASLYTYLIV